MRSSPPRVLYVLFLVLASLIPPAHAVDVLDDFDGAVLDTTVWEKTRPKTVTVDSSLLTWAADQGNWASGDISSVKRFFLPPEGETTTIEWTMGSPAIVTQNPNGDSSVRFQIGIHSANETADQREHWVNTTGGLWIDMDNIVLANTASVGGNVVSANDTKLVSTQGDTVAGITVDWNWQTERKVFKLELTSTDFTWSVDDIVLGAGTLLDQGIDTEFDNGYRVLALGMNFDAGRGSIAVDKIDIKNAGGPTSLIAAFGGVRSNPVSNEFVKLSWTADEGASLSIDQGIGNVDALTTAGGGSLVIEAPVVTEPTAVDYVLTATKGAEVVTRTFTLNVTPAPELFMEHLLDHFEGSELDPANWVQQGNKTHSVGGSRVTWAADAGQWTTGEVASVPVFPFPEAGSRPTTVKWTMAPASVTTPGTNPAGRSLRAQLGIVSSFDRNTFSLQHYSSVSGGVWLDIEQWDTGNPVGVAGQFYTTNDTKLANQNGTPAGSFTVGDWTWATEVHEFSVNLTDTGYTWFSGEIQIGSGSWADAGLDHEFVNGFRIMGMAGNWFDGSGPIGFDVIEVENGAVSGAPFLIRDLSYDAVAGTVTLSWNSKPERRYALGVSTELNGLWFEERDDLASQGEITMVTIPTDGFFVFQNGAPERVFLRISEIQQQ